MMTVAAAPLAERVRAQARHLGFDLVAFAAAEPFARDRELALASLAAGRLEGMRWITPERIRLSTDPEALLPGARSLVCLGTAYGGSSPDTASEPADRDEGGVRPRLAGRVARYAWGRDYHDVIPPRLRALSAYIVEAVGPETRCRTFVDTGPLLDRAAAARAGIGFVGKNTCILSGAYGSFVLLSAILTTAELPPDEVVPRDCGSCHACLDACPTEAFVAPRQLDATRCISYLTIEHRGSIPRELRPRLGDWVFGCDACQDVCPWNRARPALARAAPELNSATSPTLDLLEILALDEAAFRSRFRGTPLTRAKRRGLARNAAIALGNRGDRAAVPALLNALIDPEPLVREHAAWALGRLAPLPPSAMAAIEFAVEAEADAAVRRELRAALGGHAEA